MAQYWLLQATSVTEPFHPPGPTLGASSEALVRFIRNVAQQSGVLFRTSWLCFTTRERVSGSRYRDVAVVILGSSHVSPNMVSCQARQSILNLGLALVAMHLRLAHF